jgi:hypothetical protein
MSEDKRYPYWCHNFTGKAYYEYGAWMSKSMCQIEDTIDMVNGELVDGKVKSVLAHNCPDENCKTGSKVKVLVVDQYHETDDSGCEHEKLCYIHSVDNCGKRFSVLNRGTGKAPYTVVYAYESSSPDVVTFNKVTKEVEHILDEGSFDDIRNFFLTHPCLGIPASKL